MKKLKKISFIEKKETSKLNNGIFPDYLLTKEDLGYIRGSWDSYSCPKKTCNNNSESCERNEASCNVNSGSCNEDVWNSCTRDSGDCNFDSSGCGTNSGDCYSKAVYCSASNSGDCMFNLC